MTVKMNKEEVYEAVIRIQEGTSLPDKKMAELMGIQRSTYAKNKSIKEVRNNFNEANLTALKNNLKIMLNKFAQ